MVALGEQYSLGAQDEVSRKTFWQTGMSKCNKCNGPVKAFQDVAGCRRDGDAYGTEVFTCTAPDCGWKTSFQYDEYYETRGWAKGLKGIPVSMMRGWLVEHGLGHLGDAFHAQLIDGETLIRIKGELQLHQKLNLSDQDIEKLTQLLADEH